MTMHDYMALLTQEGVIGRGGIPTPITPSGPGTVPASGLSSRTPAVGSRRSSTSALAGIFTQKIFSNRVADTANYFSDVAVLVSAVPHTIGATIYNNRDQAVTLQYMGGETGGRMNIGTMGVSAQIPASTIEPWFDLPFLPVVWIRVNYATGPSSGGDPLEIVMWWQERI